MDSLLSKLAVVLCSLTIISDLYARRVLNIWLLASLVLGSSVIIIAWLQGMGGPPWPALLGLLIGFTVLFPFHAIGWMGAGDVKLFAILGFLLGAKALLPIWIIGSLIVGAHAAAILLSRHWLSHTVPAWPMAQAWVSKSSFGKRIDRARQGRQGLPYAAWLGVGALITVFNPELMNW